jgi:glycerate kinase
MPGDAGGEPLVVVAPDKMRSTLAAAQAAGVMAEAAERCGWVADAAPLSDGGEGFTEALAGLGGQLRRSEVTGPLGKPVVATWRLCGSLAVVESAAASGLELAGGAGANRPLEATSRGTGELVAAAVAAGARRVLVGAGGSASTDGGRGAVEALEEAGVVGAAELVVACDVEIGFLEAAERFAPQKGASPAEVALLRRRLEAMAGQYRRRFGVDVSARRGAGAAGGLAGGLAALGARLVPGFELVAQSLGLARRVGRAELVLSAEGRLDSSSWEGKVVGSLAAMARRAGVGLAVVAGSVEGDGARGAAARGVEVVSLEERFGPQRARSEAAACVGEATEELLRARLPRQAG